MTKPTNITLMTGQYIPVSLTEKKAGSEGAGLDISNVFKPQVEKMDAAIEAANSGNTTADRSQDQTPDINDVMLPRYFRESENIKDNDWQQVKKASTFDGSHALDGRAVTPSGGAGETNFGGMPGLKANQNSIFNPNAISEYKEDPMTKIVVEDARAKRAEAEARKEKNRDWEQIAAAKNTKTTNPMEMGFTPSRTAYQPAQLEEVQLAEVDAVIANNAKSAEAGQKAAEMKMELDKAFASKWEKDFKDDRGWEDKAHEQIVEAQGREMNVVFSEPELAPDMLKPSGATPAEGLNLDGIFKVPQDPADFKEANIKRDSSHLKNKRARREDDRSWETVNNARSRKW